MLLPAAHLQAAGTGLVFPTAPGRSSQGAAVPRPALAPADSSAAGLRVWAKKRKVDDGLREPQVGILHELTSRSMHA